METRFYQFDQNNSGGSFDSDSKLCHRIIIEATSEKEAERKAEELGCYFNGVESGNDCPCCGDRWGSADEIDFEKINSRWGGLEVYVYPKSKDGNPEISKMKKKYPSSKWIEGPKLINSHGISKVSGKILIQNIEEYAQIYANQWGGWTSPEVRIFYNDGSVKEIFEKK